MFTETDLQPQKHSMTDYHADKFITNRFVTYDFYKIFQKAFYFVFNNYQAILSYKSIIDCFRYTFIIQLFCHCIVNDSMVFAVICC